VAMVSKTAKGILLLPAEYTKTLVPGYLKCKSTAFPYTVLSLSTKPDVTPASQACMSLEDGSRVLHRYGCTAFPHIVLS
jgi:hypothetical protein